MPLITGRSNVAEIYAEAAERRWVLPAFNAENLTSTEAILAAAKEHGQRIALPDLPIIVGITRTYAHRPQAAFYTHTRNARLGLDLFMADLRVLTLPGSPFAELRVMVHLDHIQWDTDSDLFDLDDLGKYSSIMYDASVLPLDINIRRTRDFMTRHGERLFVEGACDEIGEASAGQPVALASPDLVERYMRETGVDIVVPNLGTEHRAGAADLKYRSDLARQIRERIGPRICLHGSSSVPPKQLNHLFEDGVCKVNLWTALERDSTPALFEDMLKHADQLIGPKQAAKWKTNGWLGERAPDQARLSLDYCTTTYRQAIVFEQMKQIVASFLERWYT